MKSDENKYVEYTKLVVLISLILFGVECIIFPELYFIRQSYGPIMVIAGRPFVSIIFVVSLLVVSFVLIRWNLVPIVKIQKWNKEENYEAKSFREYLKISRRGITFLIIILMSPVIIIYTLGAPLKKGLSGIAKEIFDMAMVFFIVYGILVVLYGVSKIIYLSRHSLKN